MKNFLSSMKTHENRSKHTIKKCFFLMSGTTRIRNNKNTIPSYFFRDNETLFFDQKQLLFRKSLK